MMHHLTLLCCNTSLLSPNVGSWRGGGGGSIYIYIYMIERPLGSICRLGFRSQDIYNLNNLNN